MIISIESTLSKESEKKYLDAVSIELTNELVKQGKPATFINRYEIQDQNEYLNKVAVADELHQIVVTQNMGKLIMRDQTRQMPGVFIFLEMADEKLVKLHIDRKRLQLYKIYHARGVHFESFRLPVRNRQKQIVHKSKTVNNMQQLIRHRTNQ